MKRTDLYWIHPPPHLHVYLDITYLLNVQRPEAFKMMQECDLPYKLILEGTTYYMQACGFWGGNHYWCNVIRTVGGLTGVWHHNDMENAGIAKLVSRDVENIGGPMPNTSWVIYSRAPTSAESLIIKDADYNIDRSVGNKQLLDRPFSQLEAAEDDEGPNIDVEEEPSGSEGPERSDLKMFNKTPKELDDIFASDDEGNSAKDEKVKPGELFE